MEGGTGDAHFQCLLRPFYVVSRLQPGRSVSTAHKTIIFEIIMINRRKQPACALYLFPTEGSVADDLRSNYNPVTHDIRVKKRDHNGSVRYLTTYYNARTFLMNICRATICVEFRHFYFLKGGEFFRKRATLIGIKICIIFIGI